MVCLWSAWENVDSGDYGHGTREEESYTLTAWAVRGIYLVVDGITTSDKDPDLDASMKQKKMSVLGWDRTNNLSINSRTR